MRQLKAFVGDSVRFKRGPFKGRRGKVVGIAKELLVVQIDNKRSSVNADEITNLSLAARKAWKNMPIRQVGRPRGSVQCDRVSVTLRIDRDLWEEFRKLEASGIVNDRTAIINAIIREKTNELKANGSIDGKEAE